MKLGIVGLPNVGKSTLFNALTGGGAESANYPFCTIDPNVGIVPVPDKRLDRLAEMYSPELYTPATIEFVDIAGLVKGASEGEGLRLVRIVYAELRKRGQLRHFPAFFINSGFRYLGFRLGKGYRYLPQGLVRAFAQNKTFVEAL